MNEELFSVSEWKFSISYYADDNQLSEHRMDAEMLAESIKNVAQVIKRADEILNGENRNIRTYVTAPAQEGSLTVNFLTQLIDPQLGEKILYALGFATSAEAITGGVLNALKTVSGKEILEVHTSDNKEHAELHLSDGEILELPKDEALLVASPQVRAHIKNIVSSPLYHRDNPVFKIKNEDEEIALQFSEVDIQAIKQVKTKSLPPKVDKITVTAAFSQVNFDSDKGWKVQLDEDTIVSAPLCDEAFLQAISKRTQSFKKEDAFKMVLEVTTYTNDLGQESKKYKILQVLPTS